MTKRVQKGAMFKINSKGEKKRRVQEAWSYIQQGAVQIYAVGAAAAAALALPAPAPLLSVLLKYVYRVYK